MASMLLKLSPAQKRLWYRVPPIFCEYSSANFYSQASTNFWSAEYMAIILLMSATTNAYIYIVKKGGGLDWMGEWMDTPYYVV